MGLRRVRVLTRHQMIDRLYRVKVLTQRGRGVRPV